MAWCDPCAADPLSVDELRQAGVFWLVRRRRSRSVPWRQGASGILPRAPAPGGAQNALLTRLHVRYTPQTFPEDLMFVQTKDRQNWQTRYVVQNPYEGTLQQCREKAAARAVTQLSSRPLWTMDPRRVKSRVSGELRAKLQGESPAAVEHARQLLPDRRCHSDVSRAANAAALHRLEHGRCRRFTGVAWRRTGIGRAVEVRQTLCPGSNDCRPPPGAGDGAAYCQRPSGTVWARRRF